MFFPKLRKRAKWVFVLLALVFAVGFVGFGVGAGGVGVGDVFRNSAGGEAQSVSDARDATEDNPEDAEAWRELSNALQAEGDLDEAIAALQTVTALTPNDPDAYRELGGIYLAQASDKQSAAQQVQIEAAFTGASQNFPGQFSKDGTTVVSDPIGTAVNARANERVSAIVQEASAAATGALDAYQRVAELQPADPNVQIELAQAAEQAGDATVAIAAYERFLKLAPDDPTAVSVKDRLKQLRTSSSG